MIIKKYSSEDKKDWDGFVDESKNGTFLLKRDYMDYHADRFCDHSLLYFDDKDRLIALLPANENGATLYSHQGLTYGGFILSTKSTVEQVLELFAVTKDYLSKNGFSALYYKQIPSCYHLCPAEEDEYALWRNGAEMAVCNISACIPLSGNIVTIPFERRRKRGIKRALEAGYIIEETEDLSLFWPIMLKNLRDKYDAAPVHSFEEMTLLKGRFPDEIRCFLVVKANKVEAGAIIYLTPQTIHVQYAHATETGKAEGAIDLLYSALIDKFRGDYRYFDIGTSNEDGGRILNNDLIAQKEGFGARGIAYKQFELRV